MPSTCSCRLSRATGRPRENGPCRQGSWSCFKRQGRQADNSSAVADAGDGEGGKSVSLFAARPAPRGGNKRRGRQQVKQDGWQGELIPRPLAQQPSSPIRIRRVYVAGRPKAADVIEGTQI